MTEEILRDETGCACGPVIRRTLSGLNRALFLDVAGRWLQAGLLLLGVALLILKVTPLHPHCPPRLLFLLLLPILIGALAATLRRRYSLLDAAVWLEWKNQTGGRLLQAGGPPPPPPTVDAGCSLRPAARRLLLPALFLGGAWLVPPVPIKQPVSAGAIRHRARLVESRIEQAAEQQVIREELRAELEDSLKSIDAGAERNPEAAIEAVDQTQQRLDKALLAEAQRMREAMEAAESLAASTSQTAQENETPANAEALQKMLLALDSLPECPPELQKQIQEAMKQMNCQNPGGLAENPKATLAKLDPETLKKLCESLKQASQNQLQNCSACAGLLGDPKLRELLEQLSQCNGGLPGELPGDAPGNLPGKGGVTRGRGDADLTFGEPSPEDRDRFRAGLFTPGENPLPGVSLGRTRQRAEKIAPAEFQAAERTGIRLGKTSGGAMTGADLGPGARRSAARYFEEITDEQ